MCILLYLSGILNYFKYKWIHIWTSAIYIFILAVQIQGYFTRLFSIAINRKYLLLYNNGKYYLCITAAFGRFNIVLLSWNQARRGRDHMVVGFTTLCDKVCQGLATGRWFSSSSPVSSTNKTDRHDITDILLKLALSTIKPNPSGIYGIFPN